jgi:hypothetical protein
MSTEKYGIFFPEGDGYLFCRFLGDGSRAVTSIVRSVADNEDYVRKKTKPTSANSLCSYGVYSAEVSFYREHHLIPRLKEHQDFFVLPEDHKDHDMFKSSSMIFSFCNGGTLSNFSQVLFRSSKPIPEELLWHLLNQGLQVLDFLHDGYPSVIHGDIHLENIFLHFPDSKQKFPDFYLGDFGQAHLQAPDIWEISKNPARKGLDPRMDSKGSKGIFWDVECLLDTVQEAVLGAWCGDETNDARVNEALQQFSCEFVELFTKLRNACTSSSNHSERYEDLVRLRRVVSKHAKHAQAKWADIPNFQWTREDRYQTGQSLDSHEQYQPSTGPVMFDSRYELLLQADKVPGPWRIARIDASSNKILGVEKLAFGLHEPHISEECVGGCDCWEAAKSSSIPIKGHNWDDHENIDELAQTEVDRIGMHCLLMAAAQISCGLLVSSYFDVDPEWDEQRLSSVAVQTQESSSENKIELVPSTASGEKPPPRIPTRSSTDTVKEKKKKQPVKKVATGRIGKFRL